MKQIAIFHQALDNIGGAEVLALTLARGLSADIYTTNIDAEKIKTMGFEDLLPKIKSIGRIPKQAPWRQQAQLWRFRHLNLSGQYDYYIIASDWAISATVNHHPNLWYVHSPIREIWDLNQYVRQTMVSFWKRPLFDLWIKLNRYLTGNYIAKSDKIVCNSKNTQKRIKKFLNKKADVIYPPTETKKIPYLKNGDYWLSVNRLINHKRIELQLKAFRQMPTKKLIIIGSYEKSKTFLNYKKYLETIKPDNVEILNWVEADKLRELYANCQAFITTSKDEDFGMNVVEAMAAGKAVIAPAEGGYLETIVDGKTGILIKEINEAKLIKAIKKLDDQLKNESNCLKYRQNCQNQARKFDSEIFLQKISRSLVSI